MTAKKETPLERARREWREAGAKKNQEKEVPVIDVNVPEKGERILSLSGAIKLTQETNIGQEPYVEDIKKTILVSNIPLHDSTMDEKLKAIFDVPGGIAAIRFYPKGTTRSALIQFNSYTGLADTPCQKYAKINDNFIDVQPAKICIRQYQTVKYSNFDQLLKRQHEELKQAAPLDQNSRDSEIEKLHLLLKDKDAEIKALQDIIHKMNDTLLRAEERLKMLGVPLPPSPRSPYVVVPTPATVSTPTTTTTTTTTTTSLAKSEKRLTEEEASIRLIEKLLEEKKTREAATRAKTYLCPICFDDYTVENIYILDGCFHRFCKRCLGDWVETKINDGEVKIVSCPDNNCTQEITYLEIHQIITDKDLLAKYEKFTLEKALEDIPDLRWCPRPGCGNAMIGGKDTLLMRCSNPTCQFCFCFQCKEEWHSDATCAQYQQWKRDNGGSGDNSLRIWIQQHTKKCPKCLISIEKNGGCNHMTCRSCKYEFCWVCMEQYISGHFGDGSCPQYS